MQSATLGDMRTEACALANIPPPTASTAITIAMANGWINRGINKLFRLALQAGGDTVYRKDVLVTTSTGQTIYPLPQDFYELRNVSVQSGGLGGDWMPMECFTLTERSYLLSSSPGFNGEPYKYRLVGKAAQDGSDPGSIELLPTPSSNTTVRLLYVFGPKKLANDADTFDGFAGFDEYAVKFCTREMLLRNREEERTALFEGQLATIQADVLSGLRQRDASAAPRVNLTRDPCPRRTSRFGRWS